MLTVDVALAIATLQAGHTAAYAVWLTARDLDGQGSGWVLASDLRTRLHAQGQSASTTYRHLHSALTAGHVRAEWGRDRASGRRVLRYRYQGLLALARAYGLTQLHPVPVQLPDACVATQGTFEAALWAAVQEGVTNRKRGAIKAPITRATLERLTDVPARTQRDLERRSGRVTAQPNFAVHDNPIPAAEASAWLARQRIDKPHLFVIGQRGKGTVLPAEQIANTYSTTLTKGKRGQRPRVSNALKRTAPDRVTGAADGTVRRVFWVGHRPAYESLLGRDQRRRLYRRPGGEWTTYGEGEYRDRVYWRPRKTHRTRAGAGIYRVLEPQDPNQVRLSEAEAARQAEQERAAAKIIQDDSGRPRWAGPNDPLLQRRLKGRRSETGRGRGGATAQDKGTQRQGRVVRIAKPSCLMTLNAGSF